MCAPLQRLFYRPLPPLVLTLVLALLSGCSDSSSEQAEKAADEHLFRSQSYLNQGQLRAALIEAQNAEKLLPAQADTMALTARIFESLGTLDKAEALFSKLSDAGKLDEQNHRIYLRVLIERRRFSKAMELLDASPFGGMPALKAQALMGMGRLGDAEEALSQAHQRFPDKLDTRIAEAKFRFLNGDRKELESALERLGDLPDWRASLWRARLEQASQRDEAAVESLSNVLADLKQQDVLTAWRLEATRRMMESLIRLGRSDEALKYSQMLAQSRAGGLANRYDKALAEAREGNINDASVQFRDILKESPHHSGSAMALGLIAYNQKSWQDAQQYLSTAVDSGSDSATAIKLLATVLLENGNPGLALEKIQQGLDGFPGDTGLLALKGLALQRLDKPAEATASFKLVLRDDPGNLGAAISLGQIALDKGDLNAAEAHFNAVLERDPETEAAWRGLVMSADARGNREQSLDRLRRKAGQRDSATLWLLASSLDLQFRNLDRARSDALQALSLSDNPARPRALLGALDYIEARQAFSREEYDLAYRLADRAADYRSGDIEALLLKASAATAAGKPDNALAVAGQLQENAPGLHHGYELEGDIHTRLGDMDKAEQAYTRAWSKQKNRVLAGKFMSAIELNGRDGIDFLEDWVETEPENAAAWLTLASNLEQKDRKAAAIAAYEKVNTLRPQTAAVLNNLAWLYYQTDDERARATAADGYALAPDNPAIADTYGWILWHAGDKARGRQLIEQAARAAPDNDSIRQHLARVNGDATP